MMMLIALSLGSGGVCYWDVLSNLGSLSVPGQTHQTCNVDLDGNYSSVQTVGASNGCECSIQALSVTRLQMYCPDSDYGGSVTCIPTK